MSCTLTVDPAAAAPAAASSTLTVAAVVAASSAGTGGRAGTGGAEVESAAVTLAAVVAIFEHIFVLSIDVGEQNVVASLSALGDEISTCNARQFKLF